MNFNDDNPGQFSDVNLQPEDVNVPVPDVEPNVTEPAVVNDKIQRMSPEEILKAVKKHGSLMLSHGRMLTSCPSHNDPAVCGLYPLPHPQTGDPVMVCTGPIVKQTRKGLKSDTAHRRCAYHPQRINEPPEKIGYKKDDNDSGGWI